MGVTPVTLSLKCSNPLLFFSGYERDIWVTAFCIPCHVVRSDMGDISDRGDSLLVDGGCLRAGYVPPIAKVNHLSPLGHTFEALAHGSFEHSQLLCKLLGRHGSACESLGFHHRFTLLRQTVLLSVSERRPEPIPKLERQIECLHIPPGNTKGRIGVS
jgi:hypothetical protein